MILWTALTAITKEDLFVGGGQNMVSYMIA